MRRLFTYDDGRLKTGRVAVLVFILLMAGFAVAYKISRPVDKAMLAVKHVFEAKPVPVEKAELPAEAQKHKKPEAQPKQQQKQQQKENLPQKQKQAGEKAKEPLKPGGEKVTQESAAAPPPGPKVNAEKPVQAAAKKQKSGIKPKPIAAVIEKKTAAEPLTVGKQAKEKQPIRFKPLAVESSEKEEKTGKVTLASSDYLSVYKSWQKAGEQGGGGNIPLRIENLKQAYPMFQMKAVALVEGKPYVDLTDGTRIAPGALDEYATTCFVVSNPFEKWGKELERAGLHQGKRIEVRYYMYDFIRNSIYARANRAVDCCRQKGLIPADVASGSVDLLGRAYAINRTGGGGFGVFVPVRIDLPGGKSVNVDPSCFAGSRDIDALVSAGLLR